MLTISQINQAIIAGSFTNDQLTSIFDAIKFARAQIATKNKYIFVKGTQVKFTSSKTGRVITGTIEKVNRKFVIINTVQGNWRVPASMLEAA